MQNIGNGLSFTTEKCITLLVLSLSSNLTAISYHYLFVRGMTITIDFINPPSVIAYYHSQLELKTGIDSIVVGF